MALIDRLKEREDERLAERPTPVTPAIAPARPTAPAQPTPLDRPLIGRPTSTPPAPTPLLGKPAPPPQRTPGLLTRVRTEGGAAGGIAGPAPVSPVARLRRLVRDRLVEESVNSNDGTPDDEVRQRIAQLVNEVSLSAGIPLARSERQRAIEVIEHDVMGLGPLDDLLEDPSVNEIMINSADKIYIETGGQIRRSNVRFDDNAQLMQVIDRIVASMGRRIDESSPMVDARLKDGSRVHIIIPPLSLRGPTVTVRKFGKEALTADQMIEAGSLTEPMMRFLRSCVFSRLNVAVSGGGSSGKTTTLNVLSDFIPNDERIVTIEDAAELKLRQRHVVPLETRPPNVEGRGEVTIRDLVINSLRMRPDRIVIGECRGGEALDMLQAMNTGHDGSLTTVHANSPREVVTRLETLVLMAGMELPSRAIREQISSAINLIVHQSRLRDGTRKITSISEITGIKGDDVQMQEIFRFCQTGFDDGRVVGYHEATGIVPQCLEMLEASGAGLPLDIFTAGPWVPPQE